MEKPVRCENTFLLETECAHCKDLKGDFPKPTNPKYTKQGPTIVAEFSSKCKGCDGRIKEGDKITRDPVWGWVCEGCVDDD